MTVYRASAALENLENLRISAFSHCFAQPNPTRVALIDADRDSLMTREELQRSSLALAHSLRYGLAKHGLKANLNRGDFILVFSPNHYLYTVTVLAAFAAGTPVACSSPAQTPIELAHQVKLTGATFFVVHTGLLDVFTETMKIVGISESVYRTQTILLDAPQAPVPSGWASLDALLHHGEHFEPESFDGPAASQVIGLLTITAPFATHSHH